MKWNQWHHLYLGLGIAFMGVLLRNLIVVGVGLGIAIDDWFQHAFKWEGKTPFHIGYAWIYKRSGLIRRINQWVDNLFKRRKDEV
jgi:hypothetical protein